MAKKKKEVSTKKTAGKSAVKSVKKVTPKKAAVKKKNAASTKASADKLRSKLSKSKKASAVKKKAKPVVKKAKSVKTSSAKPAKKSIAAQKKAAVKKSAAVKKTVVKKAPVKKTVSKKKAVVVKKITAKKAPVKKAVSPKKTAVAKKATVVKKATVAKKAAVVRKTTAVKKLSTAIPAAAKPAKTADNGTTKTSYVKDFALTSTADLTSEKEKESAKINASETTSGNGSTQETVIKTRLKVVEPKKKEIKHTITDAAVDPIKHLADIAVEGILEVKGRNISVLNLKNIHNRVCDYFIICQADSNTQVNAIAGSVEEMVKKITGERPYRKEGFENAEWILVDYVTVVVHIFQSQIRNFYNLESLWADAEITELAFD